MQTRWILLCSLLAMVLAGCGASPMTDEDHPTSTPSIPEGTNSSSTSSPSTPGQWDDMPIDPPLPIATNAGVEALIERAKTALAQRLSIASSQIKVLETSEAVWPDTSLGCPQAGFAYAQILTPGYLIKLIYAGNEFEYHVDVHGNVASCENPTPPSSEIPIDR